MAMIWSWISRLQHLCLFSTTTPREAFLALVLGVVTTALLYLLMPKFNLLVRTAKVFKNPTDSIIEYFGQSFCYPEEMLRGMARSNCVLSGSRALAFFFAAACELCSDWDFYVFGSVRCVGAALAFLEHCGVRWDSPYKQLEDIAAATAGTPIELDIIHFERMVDHFMHVDFLPIQPAAIVVLCEIFFTLRDNQHSRIINLHNGVVVNMVHLGDRAHYGGPSVHIIRGTTTYRGSQQKVQLIFEWNKSPLQHIFAFYGSHVQAWISGFGATHLYHALSAAGKAFYWPQNTQHKQSAEAATRKYGKRGYTFTIPTSSDTVLHQLGSASSKGAKSVDFDLDLDIPLPLEQLRRRILNSITWLEDNGRTIWLKYDLPEAHGLLDSLRRKRSILRAAGERDDTYTTMAARFCVLCNYQGAGMHGVWPDEVSGY